jgi:hypothetical protein
MLSKKGAVYSANFWRGKGKPQRLPETHSKSQFFQGISKV